MKKIVILILLICTQLLIGFQISGKPENWEFEDFIGFDEIGDCTSQTGDISSVFVRIETEKLFLRITFDDMCNQKERVDNFTNLNLSLNLKILENETLLFDNLFEINKISEIRGNNSFLRTPSRNLLEFEFDFKNQIEKEKLTFQIKIFGIF